MAQRRLAPFVPPEGATDFYFSSIVSVLTIAGLLAVQAIFALVEEAASGHNHLRSMLASAYRELTITGLISFTLFIVSAADLISDYSAALVEVENVHVFVLTLAVLYLASVLLLGVLSVTLAKEWDHIELTYAADVGAYRSLKARFLELQQLLGLTSATADASVPRGAVGARPGALTTGSIVRHPFLAREYAKSLSTLRFLEQRYRFIRASSLPSDFSFGAYLRRCKQGVLRELVEVPLGAWMILLACIIGDTLLQSVQSAPTALTSSPPAQILAVSVPVLATSIAVYAKVRSVHWHVLHNAHLSPARMDALKARFGLTTGTAADGSVEELNPRAMQGLRVQAQKELFWFARPSMLLRAMQASVWGSALASALVVRYWYVFLVPQLDASGESHGVSVSPSAWVALFAFLVGITSLLLLRSVIPLYIVALHTGELVDWRILVEAVDKQRALEKTRRAEARRAAATAAFEVAHGPAPLRERTARRLYHRYTLLPLLTGILASAFFSALLASPKLTSSRMRYGLHVALLTMLSVLLAEILLRFYTDGATVFFYSLSTLCFRKRQAELSTPGATLRGFPPRELFWRSLMHLSDLLLTATALCIAIATFVGITEPLYRARIANWDAPGAASLIDVTPQLYAASAIVGVRLARYVFAWRRMRPPPAAFRGFAEWQPEATVAAADVPQKQSGSTENGSAAAASTADAEDIAVTVAGDASSGASAGTGMAPANASAADGKQMQLGSASPPKGAADPANGQSASAGTVAAIDRTATKLQAMQRASGYFRGDVLRGDADVSALAAAASGQHKAREPAPSLPYMRAAAGAGVTVGGSRRTLVGPTSPRSDGSSGGGGDADADMFYSESTLREAAARMLAGRLAEQLRGGGAGAGASVDATPPPSMGVGSSTPATSGAGLGVSAAAAAAARSSRQLSEHDVAGAVAMPVSLSASLSSSGSAPMSSSKPAVAAAVGTASGGESDGLGDLNANLATATLTPAQRRRIRQASDLIGADLLSVLGSCGGGSFGGWRGAAGEEGVGRGALSAAANELGAPTSLRYGFSHLALPVGQPQAQTQSGGGTGGGAGGRRTSLKSLFPGPAPAAAAAAAAVVPAPAAPAPTAPAPTAPAPTALEGSQSTLPPSGCGAAADAAAAARMAADDQGVRALIAALSAAAQAAAGAAPAESQSSGDVSASALGAAALSTHAQLQAVAAAIAAQLSSLPADAKALLRAACDSNVPDSHACAPAETGGRTDSSIQGHVAVAGAAAPVPSLHICAPPAAAAAGAGTDAADHHLSHSHRSTGPGAGTMDAEPLGARTVPAMLPAHAHAAHVPAGESAASTGSSGAHAHTGIAAARLASDASIVSSPDEEAGDDKWAAFFARADRVLKRSGRSSSSLLAGRPSIGGSSAAMHMHSRLPIERVGSGATSTAAGTVSARGAGLGSGIGRGLGLGTARPSVRSPVSTATGMAGLGRGLADAIGTTGAGTLGTASDTDSGSGSVEVYSGAASSVAFRPPGALHGPAAAAGAAIRVSLAGGPVPSLHQDGFVTGDDGLHLALAVDRSPLPGGPLGYVSPAVGIAAAAAAAAASAAAEGFPAGAGPPSRPAAPERSVQASRSLGSASGAELAAALHRHVSGSDGASDGSEASRRSASSSNVFTVSGVVSAGQRPRLRDLFLPPAPSTGEGIVSEPKANTPSDL